MAQPAPPPAALATAAQSERHCARAWADYETAFDRVLTERAALIEESYFELAGRPVRLRAAGPALGQHLSRPFVHLRIGPRPPSELALQADLWDECSTAIPRPLADPRDQVGLSWPSAYGAVTAPPSGRYVRFQRFQHVSWLSPPLRRLIGWRLCGQLPFFERTRPLPALLSIWCESQGVQMLHAGLVALAGQGVLLAGTGGSGKSTTALACLHEGFEYLSDDTCGLEEQADGSFVGHSLFCTARLDPRQFAALPAYGRGAYQSDDPQEHKWLVHLDDHFPDRLRRSVPLRALALPRVVDSPRSRVRPATRGEALRQIAPSSLLLNFGPQRRGLDRLFRLVERLPAFHLELGRDLIDATERVREILCLATAG
jgi:hypothetical protein